MSYLGKFKVYDKLKDFNISKYLLNQIIYKNVELIKIGEYVLIKGEVNDKKKTEGN